MTPHSGSVRVVDLSSDWRELYDLACDARQRAHAPYSQFKVGAAVRTGSGMIYGGANVENSSYGLTVCAERVAIWKAVSAGDSELAALVVVTDVGATPCGACRQVMSEFARDMPVLVANTDGCAHLTYLDALLPAAYPYVNLIEMSSDIRSVDGTKE